MGQLGVGHSVQAKVDQRQGKAQERDAKAGGHEGPPGAREQSLVVAGPEQVGAPADHAQIAEPQKLQTHLRADCVDGRADKARHQQAGHVGQDLHKENLDPALAGDLGGGHKVALSQGQRLGPKDPRIPSPAGENQDGAHRDGSRRQPGRQHHH